MKRKNNNKGFTLVELLAVIVVLAVIMAITIPTVIGSMNKSKKQAFETVGETIKKYLESNYKTCKLNKYSSVEYDTVIFNDDCSLKTDGLSDNLIKNSGYTKNDIIEVIVNTNGEEFQLEIIPNSGGKFAGVDNLVTSEIVYKPNKPDISNGLKPVVYDEDEGKWQLVSESDPNWYDYSNQKWANAVILKNKSRKVGDYIEVDIDKTTNGNTESELDIYAMFVWIPRFSYTIGCHEEGKCYGYRLNDEKDPEPLSPPLPGAIDIKFVSVDTVDKLEADQYPRYNYSSSKKRKSEVINWYTPPAFWWDSDNDRNRYEDKGEELSGIWVGKFETSVDLESKCYEYLFYGGDFSNCLAEKEDVTPRILPNVLSLSHQDDYNKFKTALKFNNKNIYKIDIDAHMMKNSEWAAVAYLSQSIYGKYGNSSYVGINKEVYSNPSGCGEVDLYDDCPYVGTRAGYTGRSLGRANIDGEPTILNVYYKYDNTTINEDGTNGEKVSNTGTGASTTGNIYGIYDMSGGADEQVMAYVYEEDVEFGNETKPENKYFDSFSNIHYILTYESVGHALYNEISDWYNSSHEGVTGHNRIFRGGSFNYISIGNSSIFDYTTTLNYGGIGTTSFRTVLVN